MGVNAGIQGEVWPNRCSSAIDTANEALHSLAMSEGDYLHYIDVGQVLPPTHKTQCECISNASVSC